MKYEIRTIPTENGDRYQVWRIEGDSVSSLYTSWNMAAKFLRNLSNDSNDEATK